MTTAVKSAPPSARAKGPDAVAMLVEDHEKVSELFEDFENIKSESGQSAKKQELAAKICAELTIHMQLEEEIFYPRVKDELKNDDLVPEALVEHAGIKQLIIQVQGAHKQDEMYDAKISVMSEYVKHHVEEEHTEMFPQAKSAKVDMHELGAEMAARKKELLADHPTLGKPSS